MIIFGVDPGTVKCGWGEIRVDGRMVRIASGVIRRPAGWSMHRRLGGIASDIEGLIASDIEEFNKPMHVACEDSYAGVKGKARNLQTTLAVGSARGIVMAAAGRLELPFSLHAPSEIKKAVAGKGNASKEDVQRAVRAILGIEEELLEDESDALATAICGAMSWRAKVREG